ncbi:hypothetical protein DKM44_12635 [Deinococcus irradiatisoli]|uniref:Integrase SAM-like N-terminal domain-containing protein n=1 Tax=Deinococcus irradiatisoli TaxID=2202254 RepID=A0A2Z3JME9_9DEIO|nr:hypothetical protein [Deinococcus irradiatisoli]AWN23969.1 hypothetical protein DKM44_12635 [Deinococcus irradiatisoli]
MTIGENEDGSQKRRWVSGKTQTEVQEKLRALHSDLDRGMLADTERMTVAEFLKQWTDYKEREGLKPKTVQSYRDTVKRYITPHLGRAQVENSGHSASRNSSRPCTATARAPRWRPIPCGC